VAKLGLLRHNPSLTLTDTLGSSEAMGIGSSVASSPEDVLAARFRPTPNARVITEDGRFVAPGSGDIGFVAVRGNVPLSYYKDPEKSAATFRTIAGERWSVPGDSATISDDGAIVLLGRGSGCINRGGEKIFPEEVEEVLKLYPQVRDALVIGVDDERLGQEVFAVVSPEPGAQLDPEDLTSHVRNLLAGYKAPQGVLVVDDIGRAANGKPDYDRWREPLADLKASKDAHNRVRRAQ
jgi:fatty-acyl-CoA synthase